MTKHIIAVEINTIGGETISVSDATVPGVGSAVYDGILRAKNQHFNNGTDEYYVPFHAIDHVTITRTSDEEEDPENDICNPIEICPEEPEDPEEEDPEAGEE